MADRVTKNQLLEMVENLNRMLGRPETYSSPNEDGSLPQKINIGHITLYIQSPGDGWTRYRLEEVMSEGGGVRYFMGHSRNRTAKEMYHYLSGLLDGLDVVSDPSEWVNWGSYE